MISANLEVIWAMSAISAYFLSPPSTDARCVRHRAVSGRIQTLDYDWRHLAWLTALFDATYRFGENMNPMDPETPGHTKINVDL